ncbi:MAG: hypothetical protein Q7R47_01525, partial [Candidatus Diapherotrites archaeon]|nr:hypothetical protein [Candidatus Diapherotrites archaeon]
GTGDPDEGFARVSFDGFRWPDTVYGGSLGPNQIIYGDASFTSHNIPYYINLSLSASGGSFTFDGNARTWYYKTNANDVNFVLGKDNNYLNGILVNVNELRIVNGFTPNKAKSIDIDGVNYRCVSNALNNQLNCQADGNIAFAKSNVISATGGDYVGPIGNSINKSWYYDDGNTTKPAKDRAFRASPVMLEGANGQVYKYALYVNESYSPAIWLLLDGEQTFQTHAINNFSIFFGGTDISEKGDINNTTDPLYYYPDTLAIGSSPSDNQFNVAQFKTAYNYGAFYWETTKYYIDTATHSAMLYPNSNLSNYVSNINHSSSNASWMIRNDEPYLHAGYTDSGGSSAIYNTSNQKWMDFKYVEQKAPIQFTVTVQPR